MSIHSPQVLQQRAPTLDQVLLAIPSLSRNRRRQVVDALQEECIPVLQIPSVEEITSGRARIDALRPIRVEELLEGIRFRLIIISWDQALQVRLFA